MAYKIILSLRTQNEIEKSIDYYAQHSEDAPVNFIASLKKAYVNLSVNPFQRLRYKKVRAFQLENFPFVLYFIINTTANTVKILSCFHNKRNPDKRP